jgi:hypothetical protein
MITRLQIVVSDTWLTTLLIHNQRLSNVTLRGGGGRPCVNGTVEFHVSWSAGVGSMAES